MSAMSLTFDSIKLAKVVPLATEPSCDICALSLLLHSCMSLLTNSASSTIGSHCCEV